MDNDFKVENGNTHDEVLLFLDEELKSINKGTGSDSYDIKKEYEKTTKNKSYFSLMVLVCTALGVLLVSLIMSAVITNNDEKVTVSVSAFDDLNLRNLLDSVSRVQSDYDNAVKTKATLQGEMNRKIKEAQGLRDNELFVLDSLKLSSSQYKKRSAAVIDECNETINSIRLEYTPKLEEADSKIDVYKKQLDSFNSTNLDSAREKDMELNSERQLRQLERQELTDKYESQINKLEVNIDEMRIQNQEEIRRSVTEVQTKYQAEIDALDPVLTDGKASGLVADSNELSKTDFSGKEYLESHLIEDEEISAAFSEYQKYYDNYNYLNNKVAAIPQKHTIPSYVAANKAFVQEMSSTFAETTLNLYNNNQDLQNQINLQEDVFTGILTVARANAMIVSAASQDDVRIFITARARYLVKEETGVGAEISAGKSTVKGTVLLCEDGYYRFYTKLDSEGNYEPLDVGSITLGSVVKLLGK